MKKITPLFAALFCALFSCTKDNGTSSQPITYSLQGLTNLNIGSNNSASFVLNFHATTSIRETIVLSFSGLPTGITVDTTHVSFGVPDFGSFVTFTNDGTAIPGLYTATLHCVGSISGDRTFRFNINIAASNSNSSCVDSLLGIYNNCNVTSSFHHFSYSDVVFPDPSGKKDRIVFENFDGTSILYADVQCQNDSMTMPFQNGYMNISYVAKGYISGGALIINFHSSYSNDSGIVVMQR